MIKLTACACRVDSNAAGDYPCCVSTLFDGMAAVTDEVPRVVGQGHAYSQMLPEIDLDDVLVVMASGRVNGRCWPWAHAWKVKTVMVVTIVSTLCDALYYRGCDSI